MARHMKRILHTKVARMRAQNILEDAIAREYRRAWGYLARELRTLEKAGSDVPWWDEWAQGWRTNIHNALVNAVQALIDNEESYYADAGIDLSLDAETVVNEYHLTSDILNFPEKLKKRIDDAFTEWYQDAESELDTLRDTVQNIVSDKWAKLKAIAEVGGLAAATVLAGMFKGPSNRWTWDSMHDGKVCAFCESMDGQEFTERDPMPPDASHNGCRCQATPLLPGE